MVKRIALIPIKGPIMGGTQGLIPIPGIQETSKRIGEMIEKAGQDGVDGMIFEIDSPGGTPYPSKELATGIKELKVPTVAWIRENGLSGAYWVASSCDRIVADELSMVGGIGVAAIRPNFSELFEKLGIKFDTSTSGEYKELGLPTGGEKGKEFMEEQIKAVSEIFKKSVAENRGIEKEEVFKGKPYLGKEAKEIGLIDRLGGKKEAIETCRELLKADKVEIVDYGEKMREESKGVLGKMIENLFGLK